LRPRRKVSRITWQECQNYRWTLRSHAHVRGSVTDPHEREPTPAVRDYPMRSKPSCGPCSRHAIDRA
jgi:hypothetical protein